MKLKSVFFLIFIIICIFIGYFGSIEKNDYIFKINGNKIKSEEFMIYLYEQKKSFEEKGGKDIWETDFDGIPAEDVAKQNAVNTIIFVKTALEQVESLNIKLTDEDKENIKQESNNFYESLDDEMINKYKITKNDVYNVIKESYIQNLVYKYITDGFEISETDFEAYFSEYYEKNKKQLNTVSIRYIFIKSDEYENIQEAEKQAEDVYAKILIGDKFEQVQNRYSQSDEKGIIKVEEGKFEKNVEDAIYNLKQNEISDIIETNSGYYIIKAEIVETPDINILKREVEEKYIYDKKQEIYKNQNDKWAMDTTIERNDDEWNKINLN